MARSKKRTIEDLLEDTCGACHKTFKTLQGLSAHLSMSKTCAWYKKGKLREVFDLEAVYGELQQQEMVADAVELVT